MWTGGARAQSTFSHYDVLGVPVTAKPKDIKHAFRQQAKRWHPDLHQEDAAAKAKFSQCLLAYQVLSEPEARRCYDISQDVAKPTALRAASKVAAFRCAAMWIAIVHVYIRAAHLIRTRARTFGPQLPQPNDS